MKKVLPNLLLLLFFSSMQSFCQGPHVYYVTSSYIQIQYVCITNENSYDIEMPVFRITNLVNNQNYSFQTATSTIFDNINYEPWPYSFQKNGSYWKWINPIQTADTILLNFYGAYQNLNLGASEVLPFGIYTVPPPSYKDVKYVNVSIVAPNPDMVISGNELFCNNPVTFDLLHLPTSYTSATWEI